MIVQRIETAEAEARRFLKRVSELRKTYPMKHRFKEVAGLRETAAVRRASLDLSRALNQMRSPARWYEEVPDGK